MHLPRPPACTLSLACYRPPCSHSFVRLLLWLAAASCCRPQLVSFNTRRSTSHTACTASRLQVLSRPTPSLSVSFLLRFWVPGGTSNELKIITKLNIFNVKITHMLYFVWDHFLGTFSSQNKGNKCPKTTQYHMHSRIRRETSTLRKHRYLYRKTHIFSPWTHRRRMKLLLKTCCFSTWILGMRVRASFVHFGVKNEPNLAPRCPKMTPQMSQK